MKNYLLSNDSTGAQAPPAFSGVNSLYIALIIIAFYIFYPHSSTNLYYSCVNLFNNQKYKVSYSFFTKKNLVNFHKTYHCKIVTDN